MLGHERHRGDDVEAARSIGGIVSAAAVAASVAVGAERRAPVHEHAAAHRRVDDEAGVVAAQVDERAGGHQPLVAPSVSPLMKCFCRARYTASVGMAIMIEAAAMRL